MRFQSGEGGKFVNPGRRLCDAPGLTDHARHALKVRVRNVLLRVLPHALSCFSIRHPTY